MWSGASGQRHLQSQELCRAQPCSYLKQTPADLRLSTLSTLTFARHFKAFLFDSVDY